MIAARTDLGSVFEAERSLSERGSRRITKLCHVYLDIRADAGDEIRHLATMLVGRSDDILSLGASPRPSRPMKVSPDAIIRRIDAVVDHGYLDFQ